MEGLPSPRAFYSCTDSLSLPLQREVENTQRGFPLQAEEEERVECSQWCRSPSSCVGFLEMSDPA